MVVSKDNCDLDKLAELSQPLMDFLAENHNPYTYIVVNMDGAKLLQTTGGVPNKKNKDVE